MFRGFLSLFLVIGLVIVAGQSSRAADWDEAVSGDLSGDRLNPTAISLGIGSNTIKATSVGGASADREYFTVNVPTGMQLSAIFLNAYSSLDSTAFVAFQQGTTMTEPTSGTNAANLMGYTHFGPGSIPGNIVGVNFLPSMKLGLPDFGAPAPIGFNTPLPSGNYTFWSQQTGGSSTSYTFDFQVVPEPAAIGTLCLGGMIVSIAAMKRRMSRRRCE
jgi:hypothetical protein